MLVDDLVLYKGQVSAGVAFERAYCQMQANVTHVPHCEVRAAQPLRIRFVSCFFFFFFFHPFPTASSHGLNAFHLLHSRAA